METTKSYIIKTSTDFNNRLTKELKYFNVIWFKKILQFYETLEESNDEKESLKNLLNDFTTNHYSKWHQ